MSDVRPATRMAGVTRCLAVGTAIAAVARPLKRRYVRWGATDEEVATILPGDDLLPRADLTATRAVTVLASPDVVWAWIAQIGQGRAGFYSYDFLENLLGCGIHSSDRIVPEWQDVEAGSVVSLFPGGGLDVALASPRQALVLRGGIPLGRTPPPYDFTWAFCLRCRRDETTTRLVVRERYAYTSWWAPVVVEPVQVISSIMSRRMLHGIKQRAERAGIAPPATAKREPAGAHV
ncbi:MAG: hypothetical protein QOJ29_1626 [Thermoleophilaceae bacterium]|jgi:hypothetical protein|nr:hypothetical protein [Thermoleophilaceae bacterium]